MIKRPDDMTAEELTAERKRLMDNFCDLEETHAFTFGRTSVHVGTKKAQNMRVAFEEECKIYKQRLRRLKKNCRRGAPHSNRPIHYTIV